MQPVISIVIPCYNYGQYLNETLRSVVQQSFQLWECILVDNESTDNTREVCENICRTDSRFKYFSIENDGPAKARNFGVRMSTGKYIQYLDADDLLQREKLKEHIAILENRPGVDIVFGRARFFSDGDLSILYHSLEKGNEEWIPGYSGPGRKLIHRLILGNIMPICNPVFKKSTLEQIGLMDEQLKGYEDWDLFIRLACANVTFQFLEAENTFPLIRSHDRSLSKVKGHMDAYRVVVLEKNIFANSLSFINRIFILFRFLQQRNHLLFQSMKRKGVRIIHSNYVIGLNRAMLNVLSFLYLPIYFLVELTKILFRIGK